eukprot:3281759-Rhodomonas_salina.1
MPEHTPARAAGSLQPVRSDQRARVPARAHWSAARHSSPHTCSASLVPVPLLRRLAAQPQPLAAASAAPAGTSHAAVSSLPPPSMPLCAAQTAPQSRSSPSPRRPAGLRSSPPPTCRSAPPASDSTHQGLPEAPSTHSPSTLLPAPRSAQSPRPRSTVAPQEADGAVRCAAA